MRIKLSEGERGAVRDSGLYPRCLSYFKAYDSFFTWHDTRQGHSYWDDRARDEEWPWYRGSKKHDEAVRKNLTHSDRVYLSLLAFSRKHNISVFEFSNESQAPAL